MARSACIRSGNIPARISATELKNPDFAAYARAFGGHGETVEATADFAPAFERAVASGMPAILHVKIDPGGDHADIAKAAPAHVLGPIDVAQIDDRSRAAISFGQAVEIERAERVPFGDDHQRVGALRRNRRGRRRRSRSGISGRACSMPSGSIGAHLRAGVLAAP